MSGRFARGAPSGRATYCPVVGNGADSDLVVNASPSGVVRMNGHVSSDLSVTITHTATRARPMSKVEADGNHLRTVDGPWRVRGTTYGTFMPRSDGELFPEPAQVDLDFAAMASLGLNIVRVYTLPPRDVLDCAEEHGLRLIVGLHYDDWRTAERSGRRTNRSVLDAGLRAVDEAVSRCADRGSVLALSVGNEVPGDLVRLHGISAVEDTLSALVAAVHDAGAGLLATYTNYPTTEYLQVEGQDLATFNVFLEDPAAYRSYLRHLQVVTGDIPLVLTELGLASEVHGEAAQAEALGWQLWVLDESGCAGATVFSWTDEWGVSGEPVEGWGFGITDNARQPKPAAEVLRHWTAAGLEDLRADWPRVSVVVCAYNEERRIRECLESLEAVDYPDLEVIVCDDGSDDRTLEIMHEFSFKVLDLEHVGLSAARNAGMRAATGEIVAYLDADASCHPEWPYHLALSLEDEGVVVTGGPNLPFDDALFAERAVALSPGSPQHVLVADDRAEHVPGCNMAFRREALEGVGGFDVVYTAAGDDVDVCWKLLDAGGQIAFSPAAQVRHHRRDSIKGYLKQQRGYGKAERMVAGRHPHRFNRLGQARWSGFIYGGLTALPRFLRPVVYHGPMGTAPFQPVARRRAEPALGLLAGLSPLLIPLAFVGLVLALVSPWWLAVTGVSLVAGAAFAILAAAVTPVPRGEPHPRRLRATVGLLHALQPLVRAWGRARGERVGGHSAPPEWSGERLTWLNVLQRELQGGPCRVEVPGAERPWDLQVSVGPLMSCRITTAVVWDWVPRHRLSLRPRVAAGLLTAVGAAAALFWRSPTWLVLTVMLLVAEAAILRGLVATTVRSTTQVHARVR